MFAFAAEVSPAWGAESVLALFCAGSPFSSSAPAVTGRDTVAFMLLAVVCSDTVDPGPVVVLQLEEDSTRCLSTVFPALFSRSAGKRHDSLPILRECMRSRRVILLLSPGYGVLKSVSLCEVVFCRACTSEVLRLKVDWVQVEKKAFAGINWKPSISEAGP